MSTRSWHLLAFGAVLFAGAAFANAVYIGYYLWPQEEIDE